MMHDFEWSGCYQQMCGSKVRKGSAPEAHVENHRALSFFVARSVSSMKPRKGPIGLSLHRPKPMLPKLPNKFSYANSNAVSIKCQVPCPIQSFIV